MRNGVVKAVDGVSFDAAARPDACVVGETGSGKSVTARSILQIVDRARPHRRRLDPAHRADGTHGRPRQARPARPRDPRRARRRDRDDLPGADESLSPVHTIGDQIVEVLRLHLEMTQAAGARARPSSCCAQVEIPRPGTRHRPLHVRVLRRHAPARDDRHGARLQSARADRRRADDRARRHDAGRDPRPDQAAAGRRTAWP